MDSSPAIQVILSKLKDSVKNLNLLILPKHIHRLVLFRIIPHKPTTVTREMDFNSSGTGTLYVGHSNLSYHGKSSVKESSTGNRPHHTKPLTPLAWPTPSVKHILTLSRVKQLHTSLYVVVTQYF